MPNSCKMHQHYYLIRSLALSRCLSYSLQALAALTTSFATTLEMCFQRDGYRYTPWPLNEASIATRSGGSNRGNRGGKGQHQQQHSKVSRLSSGGPFRKSMGSCASSIDTSSSSGCSTSTGAGTGAGGGAGTGTGAGTDDGTDDGTGSQEEMSGRDILARMSYIGYLFQVGVLSTNIGHSPIYCLHHTHA